MKKRYFVVDTETMNDGKTTSSLALVQRKSTGEIFRGIGIANCNEKTDKFNADYGQELSFVRGYRLALERAKKALLPEYAKAYEAYMNAKIIFDRINAEMVELVKKIDSADDHEDDLLNDVIEECDDDRFEDDMPKELD